VIALGGKVNKVFCTKFNLTTFFKSQREFDKRTEIDVDHNHIVIHETEHPFLLFDSKNKRPPYEIIPDKAEKFFKIVEDAVLPLSLTPLEEMKKNVNIKQLTKVKRKAESQKEFPPDRKQPKIADFFVKK
jgi:hypothetical protein